MLSMDSINLAMTIVNKLVAHGYKAYFAGGWVRDFIMQIPSDDIDIATDAPPQVILDLFPRTILVGLNFGVVVVSMDGHQFEVSTFRKDIDYHNGRKPKSIEFTTAEEDALRRDFTINGMFYDPIEKEIHDFVGGMEDIEKRTIRSIGNPDERFYEDRLRMIRALRFAARFGFAIDSETQTAIVENADTLFPSVAIERLGSEFKKMAAYPGFATALIEMHQLGLLQVIFPDLKDLHLNDLKKRVSPLEHYSKNYPWILFLPLLFKDKDLDYLLSQCAYLRTSVKEQALIEFFFKYRKKMENFSQLKPVDWTRFYVHPHASLFIDTFAAELDAEKAAVFIEEHKLRKMELQPHIERLLKKTPVVTSIDLKKAGIPAGKTLGNLLKVAEEFAINENEGSSAQVLEWLKQSEYWPKT